MVDSIDHIIDNSTKYGINPKKICLAGLSAGAWIITGAANILGKAGQLGKIKGIFIHSGMLSDETRDISDEMLAPYEKSWGHHARAMSSIYKLHATDYNNQKDDDQLYPGKVSQEILK